MHRFVGRECKQLCSVGEASMCMWNRSKHAVKETEWTGGGRKHEPMVPEIDPADIALKLCLCTKP